MSPDDFVLNEFLSHGRNESYISTLLKEIKIFFFEENQFVFFFLANKLCCPKNGAKGYTKTLEQVSSFSCKPLVLKRLVENGSGI